jgi:hypothetical protein
MALGTPCTRTLRGGPGGGTKSEGKDHRQRGVRDAMVEIAGLKIFDHGFIVTKKSIQLEQNPGFLYRDRLDQREVGLGSKAM